MPKKSQCEGRADASSSGRYELGSYWLWYRVDRDDWAICYFEAGQGAQRGTTRRISTGIGGGEPNQPPQAAQDALAKHYLQSRQPVKAPIATIYIEELMSRWLSEHAARSLRDPARYAVGVSHWQRFFRSEQSTGVLTAPPKVSDICSTFVERFHTWRAAEGVSGHTISRDTAALRQPINWAWKRNLIESAPFIPDYKFKAEPRDLVYTVEQIAALLEAARAVEERHHIHMFAMIMLSTNARVEAVLELEKDVQLRDGLLYFNAPERQQTKKRRSTVPVCPTLAPWLELYPGRAIQWRQRKMSPVSGLIETSLTPADCIKKAFKSTLVAAGITTQAHDRQNQAIWLPPEAGLSSTVRKPKLVGHGSPNTLRHTTSTEMHRRGVPEAQIETAAGHRGQGTNNRHYRHLRPEYLTEFIDGVESLWSDVGKLTSAHLRYQRDTKVFDLQPAS